MELVNQKIGSVGSLDVEFGSVAAAPLTLSVNLVVGDGGGASANVGVSVDVGAELLRLAVASGNAEAQAIVKGLISIAPMLVAAIVPATPAKA